MCMGNLGMWTHTWIQQMPSKRCPSPPVHTPRPRPTETSPPGPPGSPPHTLITHSEKLETSKIG